MFAFVRSFSLGVRNFFYGPNVELSSSIALAGNVGVMGSVIYSVYEKPDTEWKKAVRKGEELQRLATQVLAKQKNRVDRLLQINLVQDQIIKKLMQQSKDSSERLGMGKAIGIKAPEKKLDVDIPTHIYVKDVGPKRSLLTIETADRPGLLLKIMKIMAAINIDVESAEIDTEGLVAKVKFHVSYRGAALNNSLFQVLTNCLHYYLRSF